MRRLYHLTIYRIAYIGVDHVCFQSEASSAAPAKTAAHSTEVSKP